MLHKVGLLPAGNFQQVPFAYQMYTQDDCVGWEQSNEFKKAYCIDVPIEFLGVWYATLILFSVKKSVLTGFLVGIPWTQSAFSQSAYPSLLQIL